MALPQAMPIKLPQAPQQYDKRDQDHTRRLIELLLAQTGLGISSLGEAITITPAVPRVWTPQSPIVASAVITMVSNSAAVQLLNPPTSQRNVVIYELWFAATGSQITQRMRMTSQPMNFSALSPLATMRMDERDATSVLATLKASSSVVAFATGQSQFLAQPLGNPSTTQYKPTAIISQSERGDQPIVLVPGQAVELTEGTTGAGPTFGAFIVWDEISTGVALPVASADDPRNYINAIMGGVFVGTGNVNFAQLLNPSYSPKVLRVKSIRVWGDVSNTRMRVRKTREPLHVSANPSADVTKFADGTVADSIYGQVNSSTQPLEGTGNQWLEADSFWFDKMGVVSGTGELQTVLASGGAPIYLKPGSAIEVQPGDTVTN
jgi:hypothetical protein